MKRLMSAGLMLFLCSGAISAKETPKWTTPAVKGYGAIVYDPAVAIQPDRTLAYKLIFKITDDRKKEGVNAQLWHVARMVNLLAAGGVPKTKIDIVAGIAGKATALVLSDEAYRQRYKTPNPNTRLIRELADAGVTLYVCSQAAAEHRIDMQKELNPHILKSLSLMTDLANFQLHGYVLMP
jgi:intracellular sulfur oxidation DsrE/DsrF family protein